MNALAPLGRPVLQTGPWLSSLNVNHESQCLMLFPLPWRSHFSAVTFSEPPRCLSERPAGLQWRQPVNGYPSSCNWFLFLHSLSNLCMSWSPCFFCGDSAIRDFLHINSTASGPASQRWFVSVCHFYLDLFCRALIIVLPETNIRPGFALVV